MADEFENHELTVSVDLDPLTKKIVAERYYLQGTLHRFGDKPAIVLFDPETGKPVSIYFYEHGELHRVGGPAYLEIDPGTGIVIQEKHYIKGVVHRDGDYPAVTTRHKVTGIPLAETYVVNGLWHRNNKPARIIYDPETGEISERSYFYRGQQHKKNYSICPEI